MLDPPWYIVSTRASVEFLGRNKELFGGKGRGMAEGGVRVEDGEDHLCEVDNGGLVGRGEAFLYRRGCGSVCSYGTLDPHAHSQLWKVTYAQAWTHNPLLETLPL